MASRFARSFGRHQCFLELETLSANTAIKMMNAFCPNAESVFASLSDMRDFVSAVDKCAGRPERLLMAAAGIGSMIRNPAFRGNTEALKEAFAAWNASTFQQQMSSLVQEEEMESELAAAPKAPVLKLSTSLDASQFNRRSSAVESVPAPAAPAAGAHFVQVRASGVTFFFFLKCHVCQFSLFDILRLVLTRGC
jgi:hypothetical protein